MASLRLSLLLDALAESSVIVVDSRFQSSLNGRLWDRDHLALPLKTACS